MRAHARAATMNLQHLHLHVRDRAVTEAFYGQWMGLRVDRRGAAVTFLTDELGFDLALMDDAAPAPMPDWFHLGCKLPSADAVAALCDAMAAAGVPLARELYRDATFAFFRARDPDGYAIEFYWEAPGAPLD